MWQPSNGSVSAPTTASTTAPSPIRWPHRMPGSQYCPRLMDSAPPATATSQSPSLIAWAADTIACRPLPHSRLTVKAGVCTGRPPLTAATRLQVHVAGLGVDHVAEHHVTDLARMYTRSADRLAHDGGGEIAGRAHSRARWEWPEPSTPTMIPDVSFSFCRKGPLLPLRYRR